MIPASKSAKKAQTRSGPIVSQLKSSLSPNTSAFKANAAAMAALVDELKSRKAVAALGGDEQSSNRHTERGQLLPRERVESLVDPGEPFLEL